MSGKGSLIPPSFGGRSCLIETRDSSVRISYRLASDVAFANRHIVDIFWSKPQEAPPPPDVPDIEVFLSPTRFVFKMASISTPDAKQSEAYVATTAMFFIFGVSAKEEKIAMRLPPYGKISGPSLPI